MNPSRCQTHRQRHRTPWRRDLTDCLRSFSWPVERIVLSSGQDWQLGSLRKVSSRVEGERCSCVKEAKQARVMGNCQRSALYSSCSEGARESGSRCARPVAPPGCRHGSARSRDERLHGSACSKRPCRWRSGRRWLLCCSWTCRQRSAVSLWHWQRGRQPHTIAMRHSWVMWRSQSRRRQNS